MSESRHSSRRRGQVFKFLILLATIGGVLFGADQSSPALEIIVSNETVPARGTVQFKIATGNPAAITSGRIVMDFDPAVFGDIADVAVFGATGDAHGAATIQGRHLDAVIASPTGGIGRIGNLPILTVSIPVLPDAVTGWRIPITLMAPVASSVCPPCAWKGQLGAQYSVAVRPGTFTVGGDLSIHNVVPGGGLLPAGTAIRIEGSGFTPETSIDIDQVSISAVRFVGPQEIDVTLAASTEMTGKRLHARRGQK